jgi:putative ABC transport system permease protein
MDTVVQDLRATVRSLSRSPLFALSTIATLGLGVGVITGFFAIVDAVLLTPLASHGDAVVRIWKQDAQRTIDRFPLAYPELQQWSDGARSFHSLAAVVYTDSFRGAVLAGPEAVPVTLAPVSAGFFQVMHGGAPLAGRWLAASDDGNTIEVATVVSERFWRQMSGGDPAFVGRHLPAPGGRRSYVVVGVAPANLDYPPGTDLWVSLDGHFAPAPANANLDIRSRRFANFHFLGRLRPGVTIDEARAELEVVNRAMVAQFPDDLRDMPVVVEPLLQASLGTLGPLTWFLFAGAALVFLAAGGNVAALLTMRASTQGRDVALRLALGAGRTRLARAALTESLALGAAGVLVGLVVGDLCLTVGRLIAGPEIPRLQLAAIDGRVTTFATAVTLLWVATFGTAPLWNWRDVRAVTLTQHLAIRATRSGAVLRLMLIGQVTAAVVIATAAGLLVRSLAHLNAVDRGFEARNLAVMQLLLPDAQYPTPASREAFYKRLLARLGARPGVASATTVHLGPGTGQAGLSARMMFEGQAPDEARNNPYGTWEPVTTSYFETLGIPLKEGRLFTAADDRAAAPVAIVSESVAKRYWPGQHPIGRRVQFTPQFPWTTVVGVVADTRYRQLTREWLTVYFPASQFFFYAPGAVAVRTSVDATAVIADLRRAIQLEEPQAAIYEAGTMETLLANETARPRTAVAVAMLFALFSMAVAAVGVYAVFAYEMLQRRRELAVRAAVGARPSQLLGGILRQSLMTGAAGAAIGLAVASLATRFLESMLYEVRPLDVTTFAAAGVALLALVVLASAIPARRAVRANPTVLLGSE